MSEEKTEAPTAKKKKESRTEGQVPRTQEFGGWLTLLALLAGAPAILIVWTYRDPRELVVALGLTSLTSVAYGAFLMWAFIG